LTIELRKVIIDSMKISLETLAQNTNGRWINLSDDTRSVTSVFTDTREHASDSLFVALKGENFDAHSFLEAASEVGAIAYCVEENKYNPELNKSNLPVLFVKDTLKALQEIAKAYRQTLKDFTLIGITGSNGKTSTKEITAQLLSQEFGENKVYATKANTNNHIGVPLNLLKIKEEHRFGIIELGSNHPGEIDILSDIARPDIAVITSIGSSHLEFFKDTYGVAEEKASIFNYFGDSNLAVIPEYFLKKFRCIREKLYNKKFLTFAERNLGFANITYQELSSSLDGAEFDLNWKNSQFSESVHWGIHGKHQISNGAIAALIASSLGISHSNIANHLSSCHLTGMRMKIRKSENITIINDAYNANPTSTKAGLHWLSGVLPKDNPRENFIVIGDMLELGEAGQALHLEVLQTSLNLMPLCTHILVGPIISETAKTINSHNITSFPDSAAAAEYIRNKLDQISIIYLKGSRGTRLEIIEQMFP